MWPGPSRLQVAADDGPARMLDLGWSELLVIKSVCVYSLGELSQADAILGESLEILGAATHGRAGIEPLTVLANMCAYYHDYEKAQSKLQEAMDIADRLGLVYERSHILQTLSRTELRCGSPEAAVEAAKACLEDALEQLKRRLADGPQTLDWMGRQWQLDEADLAALFAPLQ